MATTIGTMTPKFPMEMETEAQDCDSELRETRVLLQEKMRGFPLRKLQSGVTRDLEHGWMIPHLYASDAMTWGRWDWWVTVRQRGYLAKTDAIPQIEWVSNGNPQVRKMLEQCLGAIPHYGGSWLDWSSSTYADYFLAWLLYGFGHPTQTEKPQEPGGCEGASDRLYQLFQLPALLLYPHDYLGDLFAEAKFGRGCGFYPTPMDVCRMMTDMTFGNPCHDYLDQQVNDPALGTGRFLLTASNYSLRLCGQDISLTMCRASLVNAAMYAPWGYVPAPDAFFERTGPVTTPDWLADRMVDMANIGEWQRILNPCTGGGEIASRILRRMDDSCALTLVDSDPVCVAALRASGFGTEHADFLEWHRDKDGNTVSSAPSFERAVIDPPLEDGQYTGHVIHAYRLLAEGGILVAHVGGEWARVDDVRFGSFRDWLVLNATDRYRLEDGTWIIVMTKKAPRQYGQIPDFLLRIARVERESRAILTEELAKQQTPEPAAMR